MITALIVTATLANPYGAEQSSTDSAHVIRTRGLTLYLSSKGTVSRAMLGQRQLPMPLSAETLLAGTQISGDVAAKPFGKGGVEFRKELVNDKEKRRCRLVERFIPAERSVRWEIEVHGSGEPWSTAIETRLSWPDVTGASFWTAWGDNRPDAPKGSHSWTDPLVPVPFQDRTLIYGSDHFSHPQAVSIPIAVVMDEARDAGLSLVLSPEDLILDMRLNTTRQGDIVFSRTRHRIAPDRPVRFAMDLVAHPADWRAALAWMVWRYRKFFDPPNPLAGQIAGCAAYSSHSERFDPEKLMRMAFRVNWKASFDFPYMGMFLPPVTSDTQEWIDFKGKPTSINHMRDHSRKMREMGFYVLNYFNVTEFGAGIKLTPPPREAKTDADLWKHANDFLYQVLRDAILPGPNGKPIHSWRYCVVMDPGEGAYQRFLLEQAQRHIDKLPESTGICIDRLDWTRRYNSRRDDGVSWVDGKPSRSLVTSWHDIMGKLGPMMHKAGKVIYCNPHYRRLDLLRHLDGVYDEFGQMGHSLNLCALLCLRKPVMEWTILVDELQSDPDAYFQRHLHMGAFLTAPVPGNDHTILPVPWVDKHYFDYGPLLDALRGKRWVLQPHVVRVQDNKAKANLFEVPAGYVLAVTFGGKETSASVQLHDLPSLPGQKGFRIEVIHPGHETWAPLEAKQEPGLLTLDVPLCRGCAMVRLSHTWITPYRRYFTSPIRMAMGTRIGAGRIRCTLDGTDPTAESPLYNDQTTLEATTLVKAAVFVDGKRVGSVQAAEFVRVPLSAPTVTPDGGMFDGSVEVELGLCPQREHARIRYTLDGADPTDASRQYTSPVKLAESATIKARVFLPGAEPGAVASATFIKRPPLPPKPHVHLSDLKPVKATVGHFEKPGVDRSVQNKPLSIAGKRHDRGMGVHAKSELIYERKPEFKAFVAVVGVDDEMRDYDHASVVFQVFADDTLLDQTSVMRLGQVWHINAKIPEGSRRIRLILTDAGDGATCDHGDWADAGFLTK
ncbi:MAG: NPCBM/NEW2 domain-containing protein [Phycisphaerae bacterium]|nr:NPCBM/NEW2 domain-containing protein [Phycisphaerae bacterium]